MTTASCGPRHWQPGRRQRGRTDSSASQEVNPQLATDIPNRRDAGAATYGPLGSYG